MLKSLPEREAAKLLAKLAPNQANLVSTEIAKTSSASAQEQEIVVEEFATAISRPINGSDRMKAIDRLRRQIGETPFAFLDGVDVRDLLALLVDERPQTIAAVTCHLPPARAAEIIASLSPEQQLAVIRHIATIEEINLDIIHDVEAGLVASVTNRALRVVGGVDCVANIFAFINANLARELLERLTQADPELADGISRSLRSTINLPFTGVNTAAPHRPRQNVPARAA